MLTPNAVVAEALSLLDVQRRRGGRGHQSIMPGQKFARDRPDDASRDLCAA